MSDRFWQAKIYTLVKSLNLKQVRGILNNAQDEKQANIYLKALEAVLSQSSNETIINASELGGLINDASDRATFNRIPIQNNSNKIVVKHLLSGKPLNLDLEATDVSNIRALEKVRQKVQTDKEENKTEEEHLPCSLKELFWWLWRCLPQAISKQHGAESLLIPASDNLPDASIWSDDSLSAALAGALAGYKEEETESRPHLVIFSFSPIQELIKASRKMRDFWAGSWLLHYLSAKICWNIANKYGPDSLVYPSLYQQPLIDRWLLDKYPNLNNSDWIDSPSNRSLLTAGFPNVIVAVLPKSQVKAAMQTARQNLLSEWQNISDLVFEQLQSWSWMPDLDKKDPTWNGWLKSQWQTYWTALPLGKENLDLTQKEVNKQWVTAQNKTCNLWEKPLFSLEETQFIDAIKTQLESPSINVGSWWPYTFDELRFALSSVKNARTWTIPTAFTMRSTISGMGSIVTPNSQSLKIENKDQDKELIAEKQQREKNLQKYQTVLGLFDGKEQLNATETVKRGLHFVLPSLINLGELDYEEEPEEKIAASYPDLCSGVAGWLRTQPRPVWNYYNQACQKIVKDFPWTKNRKNHNKATAFMPWGIPWIDEKHKTIRFHQRYNPRLLNAGWAIEDFPTSENNNEVKKDKQDELKKLKQEINRHFSSGNNPTDWYVIAVGDGDDMNKWLKGKKLKKYEHYLGDSLLKNPPDVISKPLKDMQKKVDKRMGPSTHNALSRALLDFSNRLVPYLTEERYAGRLIYSGGDDVFAYTNLWEWDKWLWDVRQCFCGANDPLGEFSSSGDYWQWQKEERPEIIPDRPLFTMGSKATISFGLVIAHHSVPLAIALENVRKAEKGENGEEGAKDHCAVIEGKNPPKQEKYAVQVRVIFGNGNILKATSKFEVFHYWQELLETIQNLEVSQRNSLPALFEQAAQTWQDHPAPPTKDAIAAWTKAFCDRRESLKIDQSATSDIQEKLSNYVQLLIEQTQDKPCQQEKAKECDKQIQNWLKLAAFVLRNREIKLKH